MDEQKKTSGSLALNGAPQVITIPPSDPVRDRKLRVAAYARVSSGSEDQLNSFAAQNAHYTELITDNPEWEFVDVYADKGITGTSAEKRDDFQRLLADCRRGRVDKILVKSSSRFARNAKECLEAVRELKALGVGVCFEEQGIDTSELAGELLTAIFAMMDQKESENISDNIRWSIQKRMARGTFVPSSLPFGYKKDEDGGIIIDSGRAKYVRQIFSDFLKGYNMQEIAGHMKERQSVDPVLSPYQWKVKSIARILKNEKYAGNSLWQKSFRTPTLPRRSLTNRGELNQYYAPNTHPAIIDQTVFDKVQSLLREREQHYFSKAKRSTPISGMLRCGHCGALFRKQINSGIIYFICRTHTVDLAECPIGPIPERTIYDAFLRLYHKLRNQALATLMKTELPEVELYFAIGWAVCARPEKGAAVMAAEHLQASCPESKGFSPRNLRRMREFYRAYADSRGLQALALKLGWTQNVAILEGCEGSQERAWYLRAALEHRWTKTELMEQIQAGAWLQEGLDELGNTCYTESNTVSAGCLEHEKDPFYVSRQYLSEPDGRVCDEGLGEKVRSGGGVSDRLGGHQPGGDRQPSLPSSPAEAGGARHLLRRSRRPTAPQPRLRGIRPAHWDGQGQPPQHVPHLRRRLQRQDAPPDGICRPPGAGGGRSLVHRRLRRHLAGCAGGVSGAAGSNHYTRRVSPWRQRSL